MVRPVQHARAHHRGGRRPRCQGKAHVFKVDIDESRDIAARYHISSVPTLMLFKNGEPVKKNVGAVPKHAVLAMFD